MCKKNEIIYSDSEKSAILLQLSRRGHTKPKNWKLVHRELCNEGEVNFNIDALKNKLSKKLNFAVSVVSNPNSSSSLDSGVLKVRYRYVLHPKYAGQSPIINTSREFCATLVSLNKLYRLEDINIMSFRGVNPMSRSNYSIFQYKGSYGCRHAWQREVYLIERDNQNIENNQLVEVTKLA